MATLISNTDRTYLFFWENVSPEVTRVILNKKLFGYKANGKIYSGIVQKFGCVRLGKGCISVPVSNLKSVLEIFKGLNVQVHVREVVDFGEKTLLEA